MVIAPGSYTAGMAIQTRRLREALAGGMPRRGWKVGINVPEVLERLGLPHPGVGWLDGRRVFSSGAVLAASPGARLHVEPEVALELARGVSPGCSPQAANECIAGVHPALEIVDYGLPSGGLDEVVGHCMFHHATVIGPAGAPEAVSSLGDRWPTLRVGGRSGGPPRGDLVPVDPGELVAFVATYLAAFGQMLESGDLVLSGSYMATAVAMVPGEEAVADFGALGTVSARAEA